MMKKFLILFMLTFVLASCSSDGSREIQIDEVCFVPEYSPFDNRIAQEDISKQSSIFEVVPGTYPITWTLVHDLPQVQNYNVELKLKLRLKKKVNILPKAYEKLDRYPLISDFGFVLTDENGEWCEVGAVQAFYPGAPRVENLAGPYSKDAAMEFYNFLSSEPGTEYEITLNALGIKSSVDGIELIKNARGVKCVIGQEDKDFLRHTGEIID